MTFREIIGREEQNTDSIWLYREGMLYDVPDRDAQINKALDFCSEIKFALQVLKDLKEISVNTFALASERVGPSASNSLRFVERLRLRYTRVIDSAAHRHGDFSTPFGRSK